MVFQEDCLEMILDRVGMPRTPALILRPDRKQTLRRKGCNGLVTDSRQKEVSILPPGIPPKGLAFNQASCGEKNKVKITGHCNLLRVKFLSKHTIAQSQANAKQNSCPFVFPVASKRTLLNHMQPRLQEKKRKTGKLHEIQKFPFTDS